MPVMLKSSDVQQNFGKVMEQALTQDDVIVERYYQQSNPGACLPTCVCMVLSSLGDERPEKEIAQIRDSYEFGTPACRVKRLEQKGYQALFGPFTEQFSEVDTLKV